MLGGALVLWVDPRAISHSVTRLEKFLTAQDEVRFRLPPGTLKRPVSHYLGGVPFVLPHERYPRPKPLSENSSQGFMESLVNLRETPEESTWWRHHVASIEAAGAVTVKGKVLTSADELRRHLHGYLLPLLEGLVASGWDSEVAGPEIGAASVGPRGELFKSESVNHRFFLARSLGVRPFPLKVRSVHSAWWEDVVSAPSSSAWSIAVREALRRVEAAHSD